MVSPEVSAEPSSAPAEPGLVSVRPSDVEHVFGPPAVESREAVIALKRELLRADGGTRDGDWDVPGPRRFTELEVVHAIQGRIERDEPWEATAFYKRVVRALRQGQRKWGCVTEQDFRERCVSLDRLIESMAQRGYLTQGQLDTGRPDDEVRLGVRRDGTMLFLDGRHRLAAARVLGIPQIPARIVVRHETWVKFKAEVLHYASEHGGRVYQLIDHPDLADVPAGHGTDRIEIVVEALEPYAGKELRLLDIGTHWGYMAQQMERHGFRCTGVERNRASVEFAERIRVATGSSFEVWSGSIFDYPDIESTDVILALNIFHHFLKSRDGFDQLIALLRRARARAMVFEPHLHDPPAQMAGAYRNFAPDEFVAFVCKHAGFTHAEGLGRARDGRPLFKLTR